MDISSVTASARISTYDFLKNNGSVTSWTTTPSCVFGVVKHWPIWQEKNKKKQEKKCNVNVIIDIAVAGAVCSIILIFF